MSGVPPSMLRIEQAEQVDRADNGGAVVLYLHGEIDLASADVLSTAIDRAIKAGWHRVVLDFSGVEFVNATGLGVLVGATKKLRAGGGDLVVRSFQGIPSAALALTGLDQYLTFES